jgi:hypothetical protein
LVKLLYNLISKEMQYGKIVSNNLFVKSHERFS